MMYGLPAAGKSTTARALQDHFESATLLTTLAIRQKFDLFDLYSTEQRELVYAELVQEAVAEIRERSPEYLILDGNFIKRKIREPLYAIARGTNSPLYVIKCLADEVTIAERMKCREARKDDASRIQSMDDYRLAQRMLEPIEEDGQFNIIEHDTSHRNRLDRLIQRLAG
jgi:predicted kinase